MKRLLCSILLTLLASTCWAHKPSDSFLTVAIAQTQTSAQLDLALRDLDFAIGLDSDGNGEITWGEVRLAESRIAAYVLPRLDVRADGQSCPLRLQRLMINQHVDGSYAALMLTLDCQVKSTSRMDVAYRLFFDVDTLHKSIVTLRDETNSSSAIVSADKHTLTLALEHPSAWKQWLDFVKEGVSHIWQGYDHILFLLTLLLPAVLTVHQRRWHTAERFRDVLRDAVLIVSAFTLAHSITLTLAAIDVVRLPSRLVESLIALSVVLVALNNIWPVLHRRRWMVTFVFGLIHGFGFASALGELGLGRGSLLLSLSGFNIGVEAGQLLIVMVFLPLAFWLRRHRLYLPLALRGGSALIALIASLWLAERALNLQLLPTF